MGHASRIVAVAAVVLGTYGMLASSEEPDPDPFTRIVKQLESMHGRWTNGLYPDLGLPPTAATDAVVARLFEVISFTDGRVKEHKVLETRSLVIAPQSDAYTAVLVDTNLGRKLVLMRVESKTWWTRVFDAKE